MRNGKVLVDLHRHMDGNLRMESILEFAQRGNIALPAKNVAELKKIAQIHGTEPDLLGFLQKFDLIQDVIIDYEAVGQIARENVEDGIAEGIDYLELRFSPYFMSQRHGLDVDRLVETVCENVELASRYRPIQVKLIVILCRNLGLENCWKELNAAIRYKDDGVVAVDLAGDEFNFPGDLFVDHFKKARDHGLNITIHAGEARGPESVKFAVEQLGAQRIGHGVRSLEDHRVIDLLVNNQIPLEICPTSNVQTNTVPSLDKHPIRDLMRAGVVVTLNSDDPGVSDITLEHEYRLLETQLAFTPDEISSIQENGRKAAFAYQ